MEREASVAAAEQTVAVVEVERRMVPRLNNSVMGQTTTVVAPGDPTRVELQWWGFCDI